ncbi:RDD family protein [Longispora albida]|uniref:RDD family protein n=1 Tax=Longispora albida TaxID=203523 RepID=UPI00035DEC79|nr:RDD family protein [Longispora albida]
MTNDQGVQPGWHRDPADPDTQRFWDGEQWVGDSLPLDATPPPGPILATPAQVPVAPPVPQAPPGFGGLPRAQLRAAGPPPRPHGFPLATMGARLVARIIDVTAVSLLVLVANGWFLYLFLQTFVPWAREYQAQFAAGGTLPDPPERLAYLMFAMIGVLIAVWGAYEVPGIASTGQTLGKRVVGIRVVRLKGDERSEPLGRLGVGRSLRRWAQMSIPCLLWYGCCGLGFAFQFIDVISGVLNRPYQQCMHDRAVDTVVVDIREGVRT